MACRDKNKPSSFIIYDNQGKHSYWSNHNCKATGRVSLSWSQLLERSLGTLSHNFAKEIFFKLFSFLHPTTGQPFEPTEHPYLDLTWFLVGLVVLPDGYNILIGHHRHIKKKFSAMVQEFKYDLNKEILLPATQNVAFLKVYWAWKKFVCRLNFLLNQPILLVSFQMAPDKTPFRQLFQAPWGPFYSTRKMIRRVGHSCPLAHIARFLKPKVLKILVFTSYCKILLSPITYCKM